MSQKAIIAGAGPAGLTAAYELLERTNVTPIIYESTDAIGGIAQTFNYKGNRIDIGGHRFFSKSARVMEWWLRILPLEGTPPAQEKDRETIMLRRNRLSRIFYRRSFFPYPLGINFDNAKKLGLWNTFLIALSLLRAKCWPRDEKFLDGFFINRFGYRLYSTFFRDYTEKVWGVSCTQIPSDWGAQRIKGLSLLRALKHALRDLVNPTFKQEQQARETSLITQFYYPKYGPGQLWEEVAKQVKERGATLESHTRVSGVHLESGRVAAVTREHTVSGEKQRVPCEWFFSSMPLKELIPMISPPAPQAVQEVAAGLQYRDFLTVGLLLRSLHVQEKGLPPQKLVPDNWIYIQEGDVQVGRVQIFNNWSPFMVASPDTVWIGLEYFVNEGDALWSMKDEDLVKLGIAEMEKIAFIQGKDVLDSCVLRMPKAYPAYFGTYKQLSVLQEYIDAIPNLFAIGRNGMHRYNNQDHSMLTAMLAVDAIADGSVQKASLWKVNAEEEYHESANASDTHETKQAATR